MLETVCNYITCRTEEIGGTGDGSRQIGGAVGTKAINLRLELLLIDLPPARHGAVDLRIVVEADQAKLVTEREGGERGRGSKRRMSGGRGEGGREKVRGSEDREK